MSVSFFNSDRRYFWNHYMGAFKGEVSEPEPRHISPKEKWGPGSPWYLTREEFGRHRCPACGKPYVFMKSAWNCHPAESAYALWQEFAHNSGPNCFGSLGDAIRASISNPYSGYHSGGPYGL